jgi:hypothetical protein
MRRALGMEPRAGLPRSGWSLFVGVAAGTPIEPALDRLAAAFFCSLSGIGSRENPMRAPTASATKMRLPSIAWRRCRAGRPHPTLGRRQVWEGRIDGLLVFAIERFPEHGSGRYIVLVQAPKRPIAAQANLPAAQREARRFLAWQVRGRPPARERSPLERPRIRKVNR